MENPAQPSPAASDLPVVLVIDDEAPIRSALRRLLRRFAVEVVTAESGNDAVAVLSQRPVAVVVTDYMMPGMSGLELLKLIRQRWPETLSIMMTACNDIKVAADAVNNRLVHSFITKPWNLAELREQIMDAVKAYVARKESNTGDMLVRLSMARDLEQKSAAAAFALARAVDARDAYTHCHSEKVSSLAVLLGQALDLSDEQLEELRIGGLLHDLGKIGVADSVLLKEGRLTDEEFHAIRQHPAIGGSIIEPMNFSEDIVAAVVQHHENVDGSGYPNKIRGDGIRLSARIIRVVDAFDAMASDRAYRKALSMEWITGEFSRFRGIQFDERIVDAFLKLIEEGEVEKVVAEYHPS